MFGSKQSNDPGKSAKPVSISHSLNSVVEGTFVEGKLKATSDIRVDGTIKGELNCDAKVIIGPSGVIEGTVKCANAVIEGRFDGNLTVSELLNIRESAKVMGDVTYGKLIVQSGAVISGSYRIVGEVSNGVSKSVTEARTASTNKSSDAQNIAGKAQQLSEEKVN
jgi:cytoskeletal protein CcmA (bactofilin family)